MLARLTAFRNGISSRILERVERLREEQHHGKRVQLGKILAQEAPVGPIVSLPALSPRALPPNRGFSRRPARQDPLLSLVCICTSCVCRLFEALEVLESGKPDAAQLEKRAPQRTVKFSTCAMLASVRGSAVVWASAAVSRYMPAERSEAEAAALEQS